MTRESASKQPAWQDALRALPEAAPPDDVWAAIERRAFGGPPRRHAGGWWISAAAATLLAVGAGLWMLGRMPTAPAGDIASLVTQSQQLERRVARQGTSARKAEWDGRRALVYRIADLDRELAPLSIDPSRDPARAETLWRQRVALMQSLAELDRIDALRRTLAL